MWRLTVRSLAGKIVFGPRVYLSDKPMKAALKRWEGRDAHVLREFAVRGAWQNVDAVPVTGVDDPWHIVLAS